MSRSTDSEQKFNQALEYMTSNRWEEARDLLLQLREQNTTAHLESNLARSYYEGGDLAKALHHSELAMILSRSGASEMADLAYYQAQVEGGWGLPSVSLAERLTPLYARVRPGELFALSSFFLVLWLWLFFYFRKRTWALTLGLTLSSLVFLATGRLFQRVESFAISAQVARLHPAPLASTDPIMTLPAGTRFQTLKESGDFLEVQRHGAFRGWIIKDEVLALRQHFQSEQD